MDFVNEVIRFIKNNFKKLIIFSGILSAVLVGLLVAVSLFINNSYMNADQDDLAASEYYEQQFSFLVEDSQGDVVNNPELIEEELKLTGIIEEIESSYEVTLVSELMNKNQNMTITSNDSGLHHLTVSLPDKQKSNEIAHLFRDLIADKKLKVLDGRKVSLIGEVRLLQDEEKTLENMHGINGMKYVSTKYVLAVIVLAIALAVLIIIIQEWLSPTLNYMFSYDADKHSQAMILDKNEVAKHPTQVPLILTKDEERVVWLSEHNSDLLPITTKTSLEAAAKQQDKLAEAIIVIEPFQTTKKWYREQVAFCNWHQLDIKIVQLND